MSETVQQSHTEPNPNEVLIIKKLREIGIKLNNLNFTVTPTTGNDVDVTDYEALVQDEYDTGSDPINIDFLEGVMGAYNEPQ